MHLPKKTFLTQKNKNPLRPLLWETSPIQNCFPHPYICVANFIIVVFSIYFPSPSPMVLTHIFFPVGKQQTWKHLPHKNVSPIQKHVFPTTTASKMVLKNYAHSKANITPPAQTWKQLPCKYVSHIHKPLFLNIVPPFNSTILICVSFKKCGE